MATGEHNSWSCLYDKFMLIWHGNGFATQSEKKNVPGLCCVDFVASSELIRELCLIWCRPGDTILIAPGVPHVAPNILINKPLCLVSLCVLAVNTGLSILWSCVFIPWQKWDYRFMHLLCIFLEEFKSVWSLLFSNYLRLVFVNRWEVAIQLMTLYCSALADLTGECFS